MLACSPHIICVSGHRWSSGTRLIDAKDDFKPNNARKKPIKKKFLKEKCQFLIIIIIISQIMLEKKPSKATKFSEAN